MSKISCANAKKPKLDQAPTGTVTLKSDMSGWYDSSDFAEMLVSYKQDQYDMHMEPLHAYMYIPTHFAVTFSYVHTDPDCLPSFAEECSFRN